MAVSGREAVGLHIKDNHMKVAEACALLGVAVLLLAAPVGQASIFPVATLEADKAVYHWGEEVQLVHLVTNTSDTDFTFWFAGSSPRWDLYAFENAAGLEPLSLLMTQEPVWGRGDDACLPWYQTWSLPLTLSPGQTLEYHYTWDLRDEDGELVPHGVYEVVETITLAGARFTVMPEPGTLILLCSGSILALIRRVRGSRLPSLSASPGGPGAGPEHVG